MLADELLMSLCVQEAWKYQTLTLPNPTVGAMVVDKNGQIISISTHAQSGHAHAEVNALKIAYEILSGNKCEANQAQDVHCFLKQNHQGLFNQCSVYVTLEPCNHYGKTPPCAELLEIIKPQKVIIGAKEILKEASGGICRLQNAGIDVISGVLKNQCEDLLYPFLCYKQNKHFNLFKIAQRLNGDYKSGIISGSASRDFTHNQRAVGDCLIVSGKSVVEDRPILDARGAFEIYGKKAPNIKILSTQRDFDTTIPLFDVPNREVKICSEISRLGLESGFNIIEGGWGLFESLHSYVDMLLVHCSPTLKSYNQTSGFEWQGTLLHTAKVGNDALLWIKKS